MPTSSAEPERKRTDESLAGERAKADAALAEKAAIERAAAEVVERARDKADAVLATARDTADEKLETATTREQTESAIAIERKVEDRLISELRAKADETLRKEREASARVLARLIPLEREKTDQHLLTERARSDDAVANRDDFLGMVTHDLRDLLGSIQLSTRLIAELTLRQDQGQETLLQTQRIQRSAGRMNRLIGDLIDVTSIDAGKLSIVPVVADAGAAVREAVETWKPVALAKKVQLQAIDADHLAAKFDPERVLQILGNLIMNAVKFSAAGTSITVGVERIGAEARFSVSDQGVGIPTDKLDAIFERFWQIGKDDRRGLGLGLYIAQCLATAHGGKIWARSEVAVGSTFYFTVPSA
ncbi:MAG TPA: HAMP domain-containing sensor histidine kinase [Planctomycetota bacterium]|nr:HAMP domain-containing sensor histidine kinase [Planctomycetota bacterium]